MLNRIIQPLPDTPYSATAVQTVDLEQGVYTQGFLLAIDGEYAIAAGGGAATAARPEGAIQLIDDLTIKWDNFALFDQLNGLDIAAIARVFSHHTTRTPLDITVGGVGRFSAAYYIPTARMWNDKAPATEFDLAWPQFKVTSQLRAYIRWSNRIVNAGDAAGTGALFEGGTRVITWVQQPVLRIIQVCSLRGGTAKPWYIPVYQAQDSTEFTAANPRLVHNLLDQRAFDSVILQARGATATDPSRWQNLVRKVSLRASGVSFYNDVLARDVFALQRLDEHRHDLSGLWDARQIDATAAFASTGNIPYDVVLNPEFLPMWLNLADGKLGNKMNPRELSTPRFEFDVTAPAAPPARVRMIFSQLLSHPLYTSMQDAPA